MDGRMEMLGKRKGERTMNARQSLKIVSKRLADTETTLARAQTDIKDYNLCIDSVIAGEKTYCDWCEDLEECQRECKGKGCHEWWLRYRKEDETGDAGETVLSSGSERGGEIGGIAGKIKAF